MLVFRGVTLLFENQPKTCGVLFSHKTQIRSLRPVPWDSPRPLASAVNEAASVPTWHRFHHQRNGWFHQHGEISTENLEMAEIGNPSFFEGSMWMNSRCMLTVNRKRWWAIMLFPYARNLQFSSLHNIIKCYKTSWRTNVQGTYICSFHCYFYQPGNSIGHVWVETNLSTRKLTYPVRIDGWKIKFVFLKWSLFMGYV